MDICDYLRNEDRQESQEHLHEIVDRFSRKTREKFEKLNNEFCDENIPENIKKFYDFITEHNIWDAMDNTFYDRNKIVMPMVSNDISGKFILDVGCGIGLKTVFYAMNHLDKKFLGFDISTVALREANRRKEIYNLKNLEFAEMDMLDMKVDEKFDTIIADRVIHESQAVDFYKGDYDSQFGTHLTNLESVLAPKGKMLILLSPCEISGFANYFKSHVESAGLKIQRHKIIEFQRFGETDADVYFKLTRE